MDLQTLKIDLIRRISLINDISVINKFDKLLRQESINEFIDNRSLKPFTSQEFESMIDNAISDVKNGRLINQEDFHQELLISIAI